MLITIKNELSQVSLEMVFSDSIARLKTKYQQTGIKFSGRRDYIVLLYKGKELEDQMLLCDYGIPDGSIIMHIEASHQPFKGVNYESLAKSIEEQQSRRPRETDMFNAGNIWSADESGKIRRMDGGKSLISRSPSVSQKKKFSFGPPAQPAARTFFSRMVVRVGSFTFLTLPRMEGRWNGELASIPSQNDEAQICSSEIKYIEEEAVWTQRQTRTDFSGLTTVQIYKLTPIADGILKVETDDPSMRALDIRLEEISDVILLLIAVCKRTGKPILVETTTLMDNGRRLRTSQRYDEAGEFHHVYVMHEQRIVDAISGAMQKYDKKTEFGGNYLI